MNDDPPPKSRPLGLVDPADGDGLELTGTVEQVVFHNPDSGWTVIRFAVPEGTISVVGPLFGPTVGTRLAVTGRWQINPKYGRQFRAQHAVPITPETAKGIEAYLASGLIDGVGAALAQRLVETFGSDTLEVIEKTPDRLTEVEGIGKVRAERIQHALGTQLGARSTMVFLHGLGISSGLAARILRRYGPQTVTVVQSEPFRLALDVPGVGFLTADQIAARLGIDRNSPQRAQAGLLHLLAEAAQDGHVFLPQTELFTKARTLLGPQAPIEPAIDALEAEERVVRPSIVPSAVYPTPLFEAETEVIKKLKALLQTPAAPITESVDATIADFESESSLTLAPEQREAVALANCSRLLVVTGGPGTGKTTLVRGLLHLFRRAKLKLALAAPTGRAAKRMSEATSLDARTLHRLLAFDPNQQAFFHNADQPIDADVVIVDEVSMVDLPLMAALSTALTPRMRALFVGDVDQLPSVGPGQVLRDLIGSDRVPVARLSQVFRQQGGSLIIDNAHRINHGQMPVLDTPRDGLSDFYLIERNEPVAARSTLIKVVAERIPDSFGFDPFEGIQVLTPMHKGDLGAQALNSHLQARLNPEGTSVTRGERILRIGDKVMQTRNDYELGVFNGDIGRLVYIDDKKNTLKVAFDEREVTFEAAQQDALTLAYAMSIHKSQGSEYPAVVIPLTMQHFVMLHRNLFYTAVTRAKHLVVLIGDHRALRLAVERARDLRRNSGLGLRLASASD